MDELINYVWPKVKWAQWKYEPESPDGIALFKAALENDHREFAYTVAETYGEHIATDVLKAAIVAGKAKQVQGILDLGHSPDTTYQDGTSLLQRAIDMFAEDDTTSLLEDRLAIVDMLLESTGSYKALKVSVDLCKLSPIVQLQLAARLPMEKKRFKKAMAKELLQRHCENKKAERLARLADLVNKSAK